MRQYHCSHGIHVMIANDLINAVLFTIVQDADITSRICTNVKQMQMTSDKVCLLLFYVLATSNAISGRVPTCDSVHSW